MKKLIALLLLLPLVSFGQGQINPGMTFTDGQRLSAAQLNQLVANATINPAFYTSQVAAGTNLLLGDVLLVVSSGGVYHKLIGSQIINNPLLVTSQNQVPTLPPWGQIAFYDPSNNIMDFTQASNIAAALSTNIVLTNLIFFTTNGPVMDYYTNTPNFFATNQAPTNQQTYYMVWDSNGIPYTITYSNLLAPFIKPLGTNLLLSYEYNYLWHPSIYGTNLTTNAWGFYTNFPVTNLVFTNASQTNPAFLTLTDTDALPIAPANQVSNTTVQLQAIYQYITNKAAQPVGPTVARVMFNGIPISFQITNSSAVSNWFMATNNGLQDLQAVSFHFSGNAGATMPTSPQITSNQIYYVHTISASNFFVYTNYSDAQNHINNITVTGLTSTNANANVCDYLTNYTAFNEDASVVVSGGSITSGAYDIWFRTNSANSNYYAQLSTAGTGGANNPSINFDSGGAYFTNRFRIILGEVTIGFVQPYRINITVFPP